MGLVQIDLRESQKENVGIHSLTGIVFLGLEFSFFLTV